MSPYFHTRKMSTRIRLFILFLVFIYFLVNLARLNYSNNLTLGMIRNTILNNDDDETFLIDLTTTRLDGLFRILASKEIEFKSSLDALKVFSFSDLAAKKANNSKLKSKFSTQIEKYLHIHNGEVTTKKQFVDYIKNMSNFYSFSKPIIGGRWSRARSASAKN